MKKNNQAVYFQWWLDEFQKRGLVKDIKLNVKSKELLSGVHVYCTQFGKKDKFIKGISLKDPYISIIDFQVRFSMKLVNHLFCVISNDNSIMNYDYEGPGNLYQNTLFCGFHKDISNDFITLNFNIETKRNDLRFIFEPLFNSGIYLNMVNPSIGSKSLMNKTFHPERFKFTDGGLKIRKSFKSELKADNYFTKLDL